MPPRTILPKDEQASSEGSAQPGSTSSKSGKRKAVSSACIPCRKRKSKCDGGQPACSTCLAVYRTDCSYDQDIDHRRKGALRKDIQSLQVRNSALDVIVSSLRALPDAEANALLQCLRRGDQPDLLAESLSASSTTMQTLDADLSGQMGTPSSSFHSTPLLRSAEPFRSSIDKSWGDQQVSSSTTQSSGPWFRVPQDAEFVEHLLSLYFAWIHPFYTFFSKDHFLRDMARGNTKHCSAVLVNAIMALACHYSDRPNVRTERDRPETAGDYFFEEAMSLDTQTCEVSLTYVQALAIMGLREATAGRDHVGFRFSGRCMRMAKEMGLHLAVPPDEPNGLRPADIEIRKLTFWGVFNLEMGCCLCLGRTSDLNRNAYSVEKPVSNDKSETLLWQPYEDTNKTNSNAVQPMKCLLFVQQLSKLHELVNDVNLNLYAPKERFTPRRLAAAYNQYQAWYGELPESFHLTNNAMPHIMLLHMYYYMSVLQPFMKLDLSSIGLYPHEMCTYCANEISNIMNILRGMYGLRRACLSMAVALLSASTVHLLNLPDQSAAVQLTQALHDLHNMSTNVRYAACCIEIINRLATQWGITLPDSARNITPFRSPEPQDPAAPNMSIFFTQATLSNESLDALAGSTYSARHDSGGGVYEPSYTQQNYPIMPPQLQMDAGGSASSSAQHSMQATPVQPSPIQTESMWHQFPGQHAGAQQQSMMAPNMSQAGGYSMVGHPIAYPHFQNYQGPG